MKIFKLVGKGSIMNLHLDVPIHLDGEYRLALTGFYSDNNIANLRTDSNIYFFTAKDNPTENLDNYIKQFTLNKGFWTPETLQSKIRVFLQSMLDTQDVTDINPNSFTISTSDLISVSSPLRFYLDSKLCRLLGFKPCDSHSGDINKYYKADETHTASDVPRFRAVDVIEIHCNLVEHSIVNHDTHWHKHDETQILYHFFHNVPRGYKISETSQEKFYVPLKDMKEIKHIRIVIKDHENQLLVNENVNNIVYLSLIKN